MDGSRDDAFPEITQTLIGATMRLRDKSAIITGAASGIGKDIALVFALRVPKSRSPI
jgi:hypothetical protein